MQPPRKNLSYIPVIYLLLWVFLTRPPLES